MLYYKVLEVWVKFSITLGYVRAPKVRNISIIYYPPPPPFMSRNNVAAILYLAFFLLFFN